MSSSLLSEQVCGGWNVMCSGENCRCRWTATTKGSVQWLQNFTSLASLLLQYCFFNSWCPKKKIIILNKNLTDPLWAEVVKWIVHFEINFWNVLAYLKGILKGIQDVHVFVSTVFSVLTFFSQTVVVYISHIKQV